ncbi:hypothetical protein PR202_ga26294 [Eleusine coracana subsp. coracana]|uniref:Uncharacterized protein n=1 Tax=Eleusine coracana subsp. coracana TaxID=191504 RepID=A0AAV5DBJ2_ELECO|nr:hypothetical protein PR202_ga26294 [Eleusine coracana subsp. coracana]
MRDALPSDSHLPCVPDDEPRQGRVPSGCAAPRPRPSRARRQRRAAREAVGGRRPQPMRESRSAAGGEAEGKRQAIEMHTPLFYATCALGGVLSTGLTHLAVTPLDLVKCNMQVDPSKYRDISTAFGVMLQEQGLGGFFKGWMATLVGYSCQGACKFGFYEFFRKCYSDIAGPDNAAKLKTLIYLAASASAEVIADVALCPMEAVKVRVQTQPGFARGLIDGLPKIVQSEGAFGLYKGLLPLWGRQVPYTMMKFACFETIVEMVYKHAVPKPKDQCSKPLQLAVSFAGGYIAGVFCAAISHPADNLVSFLNNAQGATVADENPALVDAVGVPRE